jgi:D-glycero-beta-D-manno-heptose 1-phosphate adenylyltransferase
VKYVAPGSEAKIVLATDLRRRAAVLARPLVFTNGVFDILHRGHVTYLAEARALGAALVVAVNSDESVRRLGKGDDRPLNTEADRAAVLAALACVDLVTIFTEQVPLASIEAVKPDFYVKGGDYAIDVLAETQLVRSMGGTAIAIPFRHDRSTSMLLNRIRGASTRERR